MGNANSVSEAKSEEDPLENQGDGEESKTVIEDLKETKEEEEEEEESGECMLCQYIKGGECKEAFIELEKCVDEAMKNEEGSDVTKCKELRLMFKSCLYENATYYAPIIDGEAKVIAKALLHELQTGDERILAGDIARALNGLRAEEDPIPFLDAEVAAIAKALKDLEAQKKDNEAKGNN